jgi:hypothetical protein
MSATAPIAPGAQIELRDAVWRVERVDYTSAGSQAWFCVGVSEVVRDLEAIFLQDYEPEVRVLDPRETRLERDTSSQHRAGLLYVESLLRDVPPRCDREKDYEVAWKHFAERFGKEGPDHAS